MKIGIDTDKDSKESIRKVIKLLHDLVEDSYTNYRSAPPGSPVSDDFINIFGDDQKPSSPAPSLGVSPGLFDLFKNDTPASAPHQDEGDDDDPASLTSQGPQKPPVKVKDGDARSKKFDFPDDQISIIEYWRIFEQYRYPT